MTNECVDKVLGIREVEEATDARNEPRVVEVRLADSLYMRPNC